MEWLNLFIPDLGHPFNIAAFAILSMVLLGGIFEVLRRIRFQAQARMSKALAVLEPFTRETVFDGYEGLREQLLVIPGFGDQWREYDECLFREEKTKRIRNSLNPREFFNEDLVLSRYLDPGTVHSWPPILTGLGILGTFIGLSYGLTSVDTAATAAQMQTSIQQLIGGMRFAFATSLWGILYSVFLTLAINRIYSSARAVHNHLLDRIDELFIRHSEQDYLHQLVTTGDQQLTQMKNLAIDLVAPLEEAMARAMETSLGPAIRELVTVKRESSEEAVGKLVKEFISGLGGAADERGKRLAEVMQTAATRLNESADRLQAILREARETSEANQKLATETAGVMQTMVKAQNGSVESLSKFGAINDRLERLTTTMSKTVERLLQAESMTEKQNTKFRDDLEKLLKNIETSTTSASQLWSQHRESFELLATAVNGGVRDFTTEVQKSLVQVFSRFDDELGRAVGGFKNSIDELDEHFDNLNQILDKISSNGNRGN